MCNCNKKIKDVIKLIETMKQHLINNKDCATLDVTKAYVDGKLEVHNFILQLLENEFINEN